MAVCEHCGVKYPAASDEEWPYHNDTTGNVPHCVGEKNATIEAKDAELEDRSRPIWKLRSKADEARANAAEARVKELETEIKLAAIELDKRCNRAERIAALEQELAEAKKVSGARKAFHDLVVKERDYERTRSGRLERELAEAKKELDFWRGEK